MLAALRDSPDYLKDTYLGPLLTVRMRAIIQNIVAVTCDHIGPPMMDAAHFAVNRTAVFVLTGSDDVVAPELSGWNFFTELATPNKLFIDIAKGTHFDPAYTHPEAPFIAYYSRALRATLESAAYRAASRTEAHATRRWADPCCVPRRAVFYAVGNTTAETLLFGDGPGSLQKVLPPTEPIPADDDGYNLGKGKVGFVGCRSGEPAVPTKYAKWCEQTSKPKPDLPLFLPPADDPTAVAAKAGAAKSGSDFAALQPLGGP